jgi:murein DD-endopeptidase MepM/ murein hydrolase activator NlpD
VSLKNNIDFSVFSDPGSAKDLFSNSIRQALGYDSYGNKNKFSALVLSNPIPISPKDLKYFTGTAEISGSEKVSQFTYRARILGENSPHSFLPDPCDPTYAEDPEKALEIIAMHTLFVSSEEEGEAKSIPRIGSLVEVELNKNRFSYNIQQGRHVKVISSQAGSSADLAEQCDSLESIMNSSSPLSLAISTSAFDPEAPILQNPNPSGVITSPFGNRTGPISGESQQHPGIDFGASEGDSVLASAEGTVSRAISNCKEGDRGCGGGFGNVIHVTHEGGYTTIYAHLSETDVSVGDVVSQGQQIGKIGNTGYSTGPHLHFELKKGSTYLDPYQHLQGNYQENLAMVNGESSPDTDTPFAQDELTT